MPSAAFARSTTSASAPEAARSTSSIDAPRVELTRRSRARRSRTPSAILGRHEHELQTLETCKDNAKLEAYGDKVTSSAAASWRAEWSPELADHFREASGRARSSSPTTIAFAPSRTRVEKPFAALDGSSASAILEAVIDEGELIAAIVAAPDDDAPRLVYADWLSDRGDPRGEQIAIELALSHTRPDTPERAALAERAAALHASIGSPALDGIEIQFRSTRGMIEYARLQLPVLLSSDREILAIAPVLRSIEVSNVTASAILELLARPWFPRLRSLEMEYYVPGDALVAIAGSPAARTLDRLATHHAMLPVSAFAALGASEHLADLRTLDLGLSGTSDEAVAALLSGGLPSLTTLRLGNNTIGTAGCEAIARHVAPLQHLSIGWNRVGHRGVRAIASSPLRRDLLHLDLEHIQTGDIGCAALADADIPLQILNLRQSKVGDAGARHLLRWSSLPTSLRELDLRNNQLSADVSTELRERFGPRVLL